MTKPYLITNTNLKKMDRKVKQVLSLGGYQWEGEGKWRGRKV
jgi:hypothetical protein